MSAAVGVWGIGHWTGGAQPGGPVESAGRLERLPRLIQAGVHAALAAMGEAPGGDDVAVVVATSHGPADSMAEFLSGVVARGHARANPFLFPNLLYNALAGEVAMRAGIRGPNVTVTAGASSGAACLETALLLLETGRARRVLALSVEPGGTFLGRTYARMRRRGIAGTRPLSRLVPPADDTACALLLGPGAGAGPRLRRACTGYASTDAAFSDFAARAGEGLGPVRRVVLEGEAPASLGRFVSAAADGGAGRCLVVHRAEDGGCGAAAFEN
jgi:hypothetical protein